MVSQRLAAPALIAAISLTGISKKGTIVNDKTAIKTNRNSNNMEVIQVT
jgi:hypothetical protein